MKEGDDVWLKMPAKVGHEPVNGYVYVTIGNHVMKVDIAELWTVKPESNDVLAKRIAHLEKWNSTANSRCNVLKNELQKAHDQINVLRMENSIIPKFEK